MKDLGLVAIVAACCICSVLIVGTWYDNMTYIKKPRMVECSVNIYNMARKLNITLLDECEVNE